jgi:hypothetical protein
MSDTISQEDSVLDYTQAKREQVVNRLSSNGMPGDVKELSVILAALDGMDRAALTKKKIQSESELGSKAALAGAAITELLTNLRSQPGGDRPNATVQEAQVTAPMGLSAPSILPGELEGSDPTVNYENLIEKES